LSCSLFTSRASPSTLSLAASLRRPVKGWPVAASYPGVACGRAATGCPVASRPRTIPRKMPLTDFCNRTTIRAPHELSDSQVRPPRRLAILADPEQAHRRRRASGQRPSASPQVKLRLTANLQLRLRRKPAVPGRTGHPVRAGRRSTTRLWRSSDRSSSARRLPTAAFSAGSRACASASDVPCRGRRRPRQPFDRPDRRRPPGAASTAVSSKTTAWATPGRLPSTSALSLAERRPLSRPLLGLAPLSVSRALSHVATRRNEIIDSPPPFPRLCHREPASDAASPRSHTEAWDRRLDPTLSTEETTVALIRTKRLSSTSATGTIHEHNRGSTNPRSVCVEPARPACARTRGNLRTGLTPSATSTTGSGWRHTSSRLVESCDPPKGAGRSRGSFRHAVRCQPRFHESGAGCFRRRRLPSGWPV
jgi:hypothetical protein